MPTSPPARAAERRRRVVYFDSALFERLLDDCLRMELQRRQRGAALLARGQVLPWLPAGGAAAPADPPFLAQHLLAMLKAFADAARPAGGLDLAADGLPRELAPLIAEGQRASLAGEVVPRIARNIRAGQPVDSRLALAVLCFFRVFLEEPTLRMDDIGAREPAQLLSSRLLGLTVEMARDLLPQSALQGLLAKTEEVGTHALILVDYEREYRDMQLVVDERGVPRVTLERISRYYPLKLADYERPLRACKAYEWFEWARYTDTRLTLRHFDLDGRCLGAWDLKLNKWLDEFKGAVFVEMAPEQPPEVLAVLADFARSKAGEHGLCQLEWRERLVMNVADRDSIVSFRPVVSVKVGIDPACLREFVCSVGDSPGLVGGDGQWQLDRPLLPREVLEVRIRWRGLRPEDARRMSPSGELLADLSQRMPPMRASFG